MPKWVRTDTDKKCAKCGEVKLLAEFYSTTRKEGGIWYSGRCRPCHLAHCKELRTSENGREVNRAWRKTEAGAASRRNGLATWREKNKEKRNAHTVISNAIRDNRLKRQPCRICGDPFGEAHHLSYDDPYNVDWLCKLCHMKIHFP
jgi:ribosomal protein S27AE